MDKLANILDNNKSIDGKDAAGQYATSYYFIGKTQKWWTKLFFWRLETSFVNSYIIYNNHTTQEEKRKKTNTENLEKNY